MIWMIIPPGTPLPALDPYFHGTESDSEELIEALENINTNNDIEILTFFDRL